MGFTTFSPKEILLPEMKQQVTQTVNGTDQNLMGRNEKGQRVWGGGIKEVSASEWIPWPIDMIILNYYKQKTSEYRRLEDVKKQTVYFIIMEGEETRRSKRGKRQNHSSNK